MEQIGKRFASVTALNAVTLRLNPGEIHGLIGENGAGKSTLIKILAGVYQADSGSATLDGHPLPLGNPAAIEAAGIRVIHQGVEPDPALYRRGIGVSGPGSIAPAGGRWIADG